MFKFIKAKGPHHTAERQKLQKELFSYRRTLQHGFPHKPTALGWDPTLRLLCIGTATGAIKVFGQPGVEFYGQHQTSSNAVTKVVFLPNQGRVVSLCDDNSLHLWEVNKSSLVEVKSQALEGKLKKISTVCVETGGRHLLLGTEGGNIYLLDLTTFTMTPDIIYQDVVMQNVPQDYKLNPGAVEAICEQPHQPENILIGYNRGLMVLWNRSENRAAQTFITNQQLESLCWQQSDAEEDGKSFVSSHNDGSYMIWNTDQSSSTDSTKPIPEPVTTYGPFPCRAIPKIVTKRLKEKPLVVFSGGLPRAAHGDKYTVSVIHGEEQHVAFDFTSKVIDFVVIDSEVNTDNDPASNEDNSSLNNGNNNQGDGNPKSEPEALVVLAEEELVVIDLQTKDWKMMNLPYLVSLHASAITCNQYVSGVPEELWEQLKNAGKVQTQHLYSNRSWPINGGKLLCSKGAPLRRELLLTGHEDGTVRFWDAGGVTLTPIYKFSTAQFFTGDDLDEPPPPDPEEDEEEEWPPFRKIGIFDPYSDDPRLAVKKVVLCPLSGTLVVAGTAGHAVIAKFDTEILDGEIRVTTMNIVNDRDGFVWKGHNQLAPKQGIVHQTRGFQATSILQLHPPAAITACVLQADWGLVAAGTAHGLALFDFVKNKPVMVKCTLNPNDLTGAGDAPISRRKSFKKSLRESFRRLRKGRSQRHRTNNDNNTLAVTSPPARKLPQNSPNAPTTISANNDNNSSSNQQQQPPPFSNPLEAKPVERQIEARPVDDSMSSFVRCLYFARTFLVNVHNTNPTLWAGTNNGTVYTFTISVPSQTKRQEDDVTCHIAKEIQLKHRAPVIAIAVLDGSNRPLPEPLEVEKGVAPLPDTTTQAHRVVIASEEQFKIFTLPAVKAYCKYKLTAHEGARVRRMAFGTFTCNALSQQTAPSGGGGGEDLQQQQQQQLHTEIDLLCLTNLGDCLVLSIPDLKRQLNAAAIKREDINGISSLVFTKNAEALYLHSSSELQRISLSATFVTTARCYLPLPQGGQRQGEDNNIVSDTKKIQENNVDDEQQQQQTMISSVVGGEQGSPLIINGTTNGGGAGGENNTFSSLGDKTEAEARENSATASGGDDTLHNVTVSSSVGDITLDSVKDYLDQSSVSVTSGGASSGGIIVTKTITTILSSSGSSNTSTSNHSNRQTAADNGGITSSSSVSASTVATGNVNNSSSIAGSNSVANNTMTITTADNVIIDSHTDDGPAASILLEPTKKIQVSEILLRAPLASADEDEELPTITITMHDSSESSGVLQQTNGGEEEEEPAAL